MLFFTKPGIHISITHIKVLGEINRNNHIRYSYRVLTNPEKQEQT